MNVDDLTRLQEQAQQYVADLFEKARQQFMEPQIERDELAEYDGLTPEQHGQLLQARGEEDYGQYAEHIERARQRWGNEGQANEQLHVPGNLRGAGRR